jgi:hypothetical protein
MSHSPMLLLHIAAGTLGMLSGFVAVFLLKGSRGMVSREKYLSYQCCACQLPGRSWRS